MSTLGINGFSWADFVRVGSGSRVSRKLGPRQTGSLILYEFETCPFCRKVREAISILDLEVLFRPCPKRGERFRPRVREESGRAQFPYLVDESAGVAILESDDIVRHLFGRYGAGAIPFPLSAGGVGTLLSVAAGWAHPAEGTFVVQSHEPELPLELFAYEGSPDCRRIRAALSSMELPYLMKSAAPGSERAAELAARGLEVPVLVDPNVDGLFEGRSATLAHLESYRIR